MELNDICIDREETNYKRVSVKDATLMFTENGTTMEDLAKKLDISRLQVHLYLKEKTKNPKPIVAFKFWEISKELPTRILLDTHYTPEHLAIHLDMIKHDMKENK